MISAQPLSLEIIWLVQYDAPGRRVATARLIERFGRETVANELARRVERKGGNLISIVRARNWQRPLSERRSQWPRAL